jgi:membrane associated rhomboid family serine protease
LGTWLFASNGYHIGASGVVFGYLGFLLARGYFDRHPLNIAISVLVAVLYSRVLWGLLPANGISWEGHLFGLLSGIAIAKFASPKHIS